MNLNESAKELDELAETKKPKPSGDAGGAGVGAYVMCKVRMGYIQQVVHALRQLEVATSIAVITGEFDVLVRFDVPNLESLYLLTVERIGRIEGIERLTTLVVEKEL